MYKIILITIFLTTTCALTYSQQQYVGLYFSPTTNFRTLNKDYDYLKEYDKKTNLFNCGINYERFLTKHWSVLSGLNYSLEGYDRNPIFLQYYMYITKLRLSYAKIPIGLNYSFFPNRKFNIGLNMGVNLKWLISAKYIPEIITKVPSTNPNIDPPTTQTHTNQELREYGYNRQNIDLLVGIRFSYNTKELSFCISPEYQHAIFPTIKNKITHHPTGERLYSYGIRLTVSKKISG